MHVTFGYSMRTDMTRIGRMEFKVIGKGIVDFMTLKVSKIIFLMQFGG
jgi:hypothetical protein